MSVIVQTVLLGMLVAMAGTIPRNLTGVQYEKEWACEREVCFEADRRADKGTG